jgi:hypothetical protein
MLPSLQHLSLAVGAPMDEVAPPNRMAPRRRRSSLLRRDIQPQVRVVPRTVPLNELREIRRRNPVAEADWMRNTFRDYVIAAFEFQWRMDAQIGLLDYWDYRLNYTIPTAHEDALEISDSEFEQCDIFMFSRANSQQSLGFGMCALNHYPRTFFNALGALLRHAHFYQARRQQNDHPALGIIATDSEPPAQQVALAESYGVQCWWPSRSVAALLNPTGVDDKENQPPEEEGDA